MTATQTAIQPFHLAFPVRDLEEARDFYGRKLGCPEGRSSPDWIDFNLYGHQVVAHLSPEACGVAALNAVDGHGVPVRHFGVVLTMEQWHAMAKKLTDDGTEFHFVTDGPDAALALAVELAAGLDVRLGGGASTVRTFVAAGLVDELHLAVIPVLLGRGERLFDDGLDAAAAGYRVTEWSPSTGVLHVVLGREG